MRSNNKTKFVKKYWCIFQLNFRARSPVNFVLASPDLLESYVVHFFLFWRGEARIQPTWYRSELPWRLCCGSGCQNWKLMMRDYPATVCGEKFFKTPNPTAPVLHHHRAGGKEKNGDGWRITSIHKFSARCLCVMFIFLSFYSLRQSIRCFHSIPVLRATSLTEEMFVVDESELEYSMLPKYRRESEAHVRLSSFYQNSIHEIIGYWTDRPPEQENAERASLATRGVILSFVSGEWHPVK